MSLVELLSAENVAEFNATRGERSKVDLFAADLAEKNLREVDLSGADVDKADLTGSDLTSAGLYKARMNGIDGTGMKLVNCLGARVKLREAWLDEADLSGSDFANADFSEAVVTKTTARGMRMTGGKLKAIDAKHAQWAGVDLSSTHMGKADFTDATLSGSDLTEAAGAEILFTRAKLDGVVASGARIPLANFEGANLTGARFDGANLAEANFTGADLSGCDLTGANLAGATFEGAVLTGAVLAEAALDGVDLTGLDLTDVDLTGLDATLLGLSEAQRDAVLMVGIPVNPDARLKPTKPGVARNGDLVAGVWDNDDGEELTTVRWFSVVGKKVQHGILPVSSATILVRTAVAVGDGVDLVLIRRRPDTVVVERFHIDGAGALVSNQTAPLGYDPMVIPIVRHDGAGMRMWGLARRGPTLVVTADTEDGFKPIATKTLATARGFLGRHDPFLSAKGGVMMPCTARGVGGPFKKPEGFPGRHPSAIEVEKRWLAVWVEPPADREKGGIRMAWMGGRGEPEVTPVTRNGAVLSLDALSFDGEAHLCWVELVGLGDTKAFVQTVPDGKPRQLDIDDVDELVFAAGPGDRPVLVATTDEERVVVLRWDGKKVGTLEE